MTPGDAPFGGLGIWKYPIRDIAEPLLDHEIEVPVGSKVLSVGRQGRDLVVWVLGARYGTGPDVSETETLWFRIGLTGHDPRLHKFGGLERFLGTVEFEEYGLVLHVWQI